MERGSALDCGSASYRLPSRADESGSFAAALKGAMLMRRATN